MLPIASLISNPIPDAMTLSPGSAPVLVMLVVVLLGLGEIIRAVRAQYREQRSVRTVASPISRRQQPTAPAKPPLAA